MIIFTYFILSAVIPTVILLFAALPSRRAAVVATVAAWLFLPNLRFDLPGLPDYTKTSATTLGVLLGVLIFDPGALLALRPRWFDLPIVTWCLAPFASSLSNGLGVYDGCSGLLVTVMEWGIPYLIGRIYFADLEGLRELAMGIVVGGLIYIPLCLYEIRFSPQLEYHIYGIVSWEGVRYGGFRPKVFLGRGLLLGMFMTAASMTGYWLWADGTVRRLRGFPFGGPLALLLATTVLCKSTGALTLLATGLVLHELIRRTGWALPIWALVAVAPFYEITRTTSLWSAKELVGVAASAFGPDRAQSLEFRLYNEDMLIEKALQQKIFGWGGWNRARVFRQGRDVSITDGYWIIALGNNGIVGLASLTTSLLLPLVLLIRRYRVRDWTTPAVSPAAVLAILLALYMIDNLSNAMPNPIYAVAVGGLTALDPRRAARRAEEGEPSGRPVSPGSDRGPTREPGPVTLLDPRHRRAEGQRARAAQLAGAGRPDVAIDLYRRTWQFQEELVARHPGVALYRHGLALTCIELGRLLGDSGLTREAKRTWCRALEVLSGLVGDSPDVPEYQGQWLELLNDLAWLLANDPDPMVGDRALAVSWAAQAVERDPDNATYWNTLGAARYRAGDWPGAVEALGQSVRLGSGGTSFDHFYLALALAQCGDHATARQWYGRALSWMDEHLPRHAGLLQLRGETADLLGDPGARADVSPTIRSLPTSKAVGRPEHQHETIGSSSDLSHPGPKDGGT